MFFDLLIIVIGFILLVFGSDLLVKGASNIAKKFHIPDILIGLTIVAIGTSAPELIVTIQSALSSNTGLIIGNAIGSNFCNLLLILGLMATIRPVSIDLDTKKIHLPFAIFATFITLILCLGFDNHFFCMDVDWLNSYLLNRIDGIILILCFLLYLFYLVSLEIKDIVASYRENKKKSNDLTKNTSSSLFKKTNNTNMVFSLFIFILGIVLLKYGSDFVVDSAVNIAEIMRSF